MVLLKNSSTHALLSIPHMCSYEPSPQHPVTLYPVGRIRLWNEYVRALCAVPSCPMTFLSTRRKPESNNGTSLAREHAGRPNFHSGKWPFFDHLRPSAWVTFVAYSPSQLDIQLVRMPCAAHMWFIAVRSQAHVVMVSPTNRHDC